MIESKDEINKSNKTDEGNLDLERHFKAALDIPSLGKSLADVYKVGSLPLALLFAVLIIAVYLISNRLILDMTKTLGFVIVFFAITSVVIYIILSIFGYLKWREELRTEKDMVLHEQDIKVTIYNRELEFQEQYIKLITDKSIELASQNREAVAIKTIIDTTTAALTQILPDILEMRRKVLSSFPKQPSSQKDESGNSLQ
jgi:hypothetical protein